MKAFRAMMGRIRRQSALLSTATVVLAGICVAQTQSAPEIAKRAFLSTVLIVMEDAKGQPLSLGSGFFVRENQIASNTHVVEGAAKGYAKIIGQKAKHEIEGITAIDADRDLIILKVSGASSPPLELGNSESIQVGETVFAVGNPQGLEGTFSQGIISSIRDVGNDKLLQITAPISPGSSGGPVLNENGEVIGVSVATFRGGQNLNFAIPSNYLIALLGRIESPRPLSLANTKKGQRSILAGLGGPSSEGVIGEQLTWEWEYGQSGQYAFSLRNRLRESVKNIYCLVIFRDIVGIPIDYDIVHYSGIIPGGLAKRIESQVHSSVQQMTTPRGNRVPQAKVVFRILNFEILD